MNQIEHRLVCIAEEAGEVAKAASKALRFGLDDRRSDRDENNLQNLINEIQDLNGAAVSLLRLLFKGEIPVDSDYGFLDADAVLLINPKAIDAKVEKITYYEEYARATGALDPAQPQSD